MYKLASINPAPTPSGSANNGPPSESYGAAVVSWLALAGLGAIVRAASCYAASRVILGEAVSIRKSFGRFTSKIWLLVWLTILQGFYAGWPYLVATFVSVIAASPGSAFRGVVLLLGLIPCAIFFAWYALAFPTIAIEGQAPQRAIDRSLSLGRGGRRRVFCGVAVAYAPPLMLTYGIPVLVNTMLIGNAWQTANPFLVSGIEGVAGLIATLVFTPYAHIVLTLLYYDQRIRKEGFDVEQMMQAAGLDENAALPDVGA
jgi:hypothetical protein